MKTTPNGSPNRIPLLAIFCLALMILAASPKRALAQTNTFPDTGNVGVGTTTPASILTVETTGPDSGATKYLRVKNTSSFTGILLDPGQAGDAGWLLMGGYPNPGDFTVRELNVVNYLTIKKTTGHIGIGTDNRSVSLGDTGQSTTLAVQGAGAYSMLRC